MSNEDVPQSNMVARAEGCYISREAIQNVKVQMDGAIMIILKPSIDGRELFNAIDEAIDRKNRGEAIE